MVLNVHCIWKDLVVIMCIAHGRFTVISAFRDLGLSDVGLFWWTRPVTSACAAVNSASTAMISACIASDLGLFEGVMLARNKCPTVNSACAAVISACHFL